MVNVGKRHELYDSKIIWIGNNYATRMMPIKQKQYVRYMKDKFGLSKSHWLHIRRYFKENEKKGMSFRISLRGQKMNDNRNYYNLRLNQYKVKYFTHSREFSIQSTWGREKTKLYFNIRKW